MPEIVLEKPELFVVEDPDLVAKIADQAATYDELRSSIGDPDLRLYVMGWVLEGTDISRKWAYSAGCRVLSLVGPYPEFPNIFADVFVGDEKHGIVLNATYRNAPSELLAEHSDRVMKSLMFGGMAFPHPELVDSPPGILGRTSFITIPAIGDRALAGAVPRQLTASMAL